MSTVLLFVLGFVLLSVGANWLVRGASRLAIAFGIAPLIVGLTVVALGTSAPELAVSVDSALSGQPDLALGNVVGSNIANILLILGLSALITPLAVARQLLWLQVPLMIVVSVTLWILALDGIISFANGLLLTAGLMAYLGFTIYQSQRERIVRKAPHQPARQQQGLVAILRNLLLVAAGLGVLAIGAHWLVAGAVAAARWLGVSELIIGLTIVAVGTSLPEIATALIAAWRGERDIAIGNVVGSNIFNILAVLGITSLVAPSGITVVPSALSFDLPIMIVVALVCLAVCFTGDRIDRWEGGMLLGYYPIYLVFLVLIATGYEALTSFSSVLVWFALPLTVLLSAVSMMQHGWRRSPQ